MVIPQPGPVSFLAPAPDYSVACFAGGDVVVAVVRLHAVRFVGCTLLVAWLGGAPAVVAQKVILSENFENATPDTRPISANFYSRSVLPWVNQATEPAKIVVTGGAFPDPFSPANHSLVFHNPNSAAQMAITWTSAFQDDPSTFKNGSIEFDLWMEKPLPILGQPGGKFWSFIDARLGYGNAERSGVSTVNDVTIWNNLRIQNVNQPEPVESVVDAGAQLSVGLQTTYTDPVPGGLMAPDQSFHLRYEISGAAGNESYVLTVNGTPIRWLQDQETSHPWVPGAPGINVISFLTDASAYFSGGASNVYLDNLVVINNDLPPGVNGDYNNNGTVDAADYVLWRNGGPLTNEVADPGAVSAQDYTEWRNRFGSVTGSGLGAGSSVPEPNSLILWTIVVALVGFCRIRP